MYTILQTTSEYIQASSRVGRRYPGLVVTVYSHARSKDNRYMKVLSTINHYKYVESVSLTPFLRVREIVLYRLYSLLLNIMELRAPQSTITTCLPLKQRLDTRCE